MTPVECEESRLCVSIHACPLLVLLPGQLGSLELLHVFVETAKEAEVQGKHTHSGPASS